MSEDLFQRYLEEIAEVARRGDAREESYYPALKKLLERYATSSGRDEAHVTIVPQLTAGGNPDGRVWDGDQHITGYLEAKKPGTDLDEVEESEQLRRYRSTFPNLLLTDFCEFRLYRDGDLVLEAQAGHPSSLLVRETSPNVDEGETTGDLVERFFRYSVARSYDAESLAIELAERTRYLRDAVHEQLEEEIDDEQGDLLGFYDAFQTYLVAGLEPQEFADLYAQTLTYGLFAGRVRAGNDFNRTDAAEHIPNSLGLLNEIFSYVSNDRRVPQSLEWIVDEIASVLAVADAGAILDRYYQQGKGQDPVAHFYETFLAEYDPEEREQRGVYYTPESVVSYITRSLHGLLKERFGKGDGLASDGVTLLDPAAGTMTFVANAVREATKEFSKYGDGAVEGFLTDHVLENYYGFELMMAPYAVGHLKMSFLLEELGHQLGDDERVRLYLTNTLEMEELEQTEIPILKSLAQESSLAGEVKTDTPILAILGNPPYSGHSANQGEWITGLIEDYKQVDGEPLGERNPKWLQDDYVKFIRFAQWKIEQQGEGLVGMITNHSWLDNPTFRGMRQSLQDTFDEIRVLDLHGNSLKKESAPDGGPDQNVFDIRQGVAISFFLKHSGASDDEPASVYHAELWGSRENKYRWLEEHDFGDTNWEQVSPKSEFYVYLPRDEAALDRYKTFPKVTDIFPVNSVGIVTSRDSFVIDFDRHALAKRIETFRDAELSDKQVREALNLSDNRDWKLSKKRPKVQADDSWQEKIIRVLYRPFDQRWIFYHKHAIDFGRKQVMRHMLADKNLALITNRQVRGTEGFYHALVAEQPSDFHVLETAHASPYHFPLYLYPEPSKEQTAHFDEDRQRSPNLASGLRSALRTSYGRTPSPEEILYYIYSVLYAHSYREKYADFLKIDFPRLPFTKNADLFDEYADLGHQLVELHLLESANLDDPVMQFHGEGDNEIVRRKSQGFRYDAKKERKYINEDQYFAPLPRELWEYQIGGYQVLRKWLKDRKERKLTSDDIRTYCRIATALQKTIELQERIDALYPDVERDCVALNLET